VNVNATVTNVSAQLLAANVNRAYLIIQNKDSAGTIYVNFGAAATVANGIAIAPGGAYELNGTCSTQQIFAIGSIGSNANVVTVEG
jgi:glutamate 5-kinase